MLQRDDIKQILEKLNELRTFMRVVTITLGVITGWMFYLTFIK